MRIIGPTPISGKISTAAIDDNAVTLAKMASGTDGNVISYDASTNPVAIATGTSGHFLKSQGAGAQPVFAAAGGAWNLIGTSVASSSASLTQTGLDSTYDTYAIALSDLVPATDNVDPYFRFGDSSGIDNSASDYVWAIDGEQSSDTTYSPTGGVDNSDSEIALSQSASTVNGVGNASGEGLSGVFWLGQPGDSTMRTTLQGTYSFWDGSTVFHRFTGGGARNAIITCDRIQFLFASGNIATGRMTVWGLAHA